MAHVPMRMCVACREHKPQSELIRITVKEHDGKATPDNKKKSSGRGAYICRSEECIKKAEKKHIIERHLKCYPSESLYSDVEGKL